MTYPLIGNYGRADRRRPVAPAVAPGAGRRERDGGRPRRRPPARPRSCATTGIPAIAGVDTRALARHLRVERVSLRGIVTEPGFVDRDAAVERARAVPRWEDQDFVGQVSPASIMDVGAHDEGGPLIGIVDFGLKSNIVRGMRRRGARVRILPHTISTVGRARPRHRRPDPLAGTGRSGAARRARSRWPGRSSTTAGRCSGSASATRSWRGRRAPRRRRLRFGHHGANHPVRDVELGLVQVTAQNHEVQVVGRVACRPASGFRVSQVNLNDGSVEGLRHATLPIETVQYHPEGAPGPLDALAVFDRFVARAARRAAERSR